MLVKKHHYIGMSFYGFIEKTEFRCLMEQAKQTSVKDAIKKLNEFDAMNESFFRAAMPESAPDLLIKKHTNKLLRKKRLKDIKRYLGYL